MTESTMTRRELEDTVIKLALTDQSFRGALLANPKAAVETALSGQLSGAKLPAKLEVKVIEEASNTLHIVIPAVQELSEEDLERVAGGRLVLSPIDTPICVFITDLPFA